MDIRKAIAAQVIFPIQTGVIMFQTQNKTEVEHMGTEIERKFLVTGENWKKSIESEIIKQGYLSADPGRVVRVRVAGAKAFLTVKGAPIGMKRDEYEYSIPRADAEEMLENLCKKPLVEKIRHFLDHNGASWIVDEFKGANDGLIIAEIELQSENSQVDLPDWVGKEVTEDRRYANSNLANNPFKEWGAPLDKQD